MVPHNQQTLIEILFGGLRTWLSGRAPASTRKALGSLPSRAEERRSETFVL